MTSGIVAEGAANHRRTDSNLAYCPQRLTTCSLTCLPSKLALAGSYLMVPVGRRNWLTKGVLVESVVYPEIELRVCVPAGVEFAPTAAVATSSPSPPQWPRVKSSS